ncbi:MAG: hypothetical protein IJP43_03940 [Oscillospiraceae bacterium]|nr:hypothetical protein [Oscillospiraceae bacterium]
MKKLMSLVLALTMIFALAACQTSQPADTDETAKAEEPAKTEEPAKSGEAAPAEEDGQNPVMNFIGTYGCGRAGMTVEADGMDGANIEVIWGSSAWESSIWTIHGTLDKDAETLTLNYDGAKRVNRTYLDEERFEDEVVYEDGTGKIFFNDDYTITWQDDKENAAEDMVFTTGGEEADYETYAVASSFSKAIVEGFASDIKNALLEGDYDAVADMTSFPVNTAKGALDTPEALKEYLAGAIDDSVRASLEAETCTDMFANSHGISMADGSVWFAEIIVDGVNMLKIINIL